MHFDFRRKLFDQPVERHRPFRIGERNRAQHRIGPFVYVRHRPQSALRRAERGDRAVQSSEASDRLRDIADTRAGVLGDQPITKCADRLRGLRIGMRFHHEVALGVEAHRTVAEIGRADAQPFIVDDHELRMHVDARPLRQAGDIGVVHLKPTVPIGRPQIADELGAQHLHRHLFQPAMAQQARDQHDLGSLGLLQPLRKRSADLLCREVLVLDEDVLPRPRDHVEVEPLDIAHPFARLLPWRGASDRHLRVHDLRRHVLRPRIMVDSDLG